MSSNLISPTIFMKNQKEYLLHIETLEGKANEILEGLKKLKTEIVIVDGKEDNNKTVNQAPTVNYMDASTMKTPYVILLYGNPINVRVARHEGKYVTRRVWPSEEAAQQAWDYLPSDSWYKLAEASGLYRRAIVRWVPAHDKMVYHERGVYISDLRVAVKARKTQEVGR